MIILRNQSKYPAWLLKLLLEEVMHLTGIKIPVIVRVHDNFTGQAGETHQGDLLHTIELESPYIRTEDIDSFVRNFLHELGHVRDLCCDPERTLLTWTTTAQRENVEWAQRPEEIRANLFANHYEQKTKRSSKVHLLMSLLREKNNESINSR